MGSLSDADTIPSRAEAIIPIRSRDSVRQSPTPVIILLVFLILNHHRDEAAVGRPMSPRMLIAGRFEMAGRARAPRKGSGTDLLGQALEIDVSGTNEFWVAMMNKIGQ
jgi:hypothetical protein